MQTRTGKWGRRVSMGVLGAAVWLLAAGEVFAGHDFHRPRSYDAHPRYYRRPPHGAMDVRAGGSRYFFHLGWFYHSTPAGYVVVPAPVGAVVTALPANYQTIVYGDVPYYYYNDTYYVRKPVGYTVVSPPPQVVVQNPVAVEAPEKTVVVNVPNPNGSFMPIVLEKYSNGYVGPQGEFYPDYPRIEQLEAMYSKTSQAYAPPPEDEEIVINVPNANGSYTPVTLIKSDKGYIGPQDEFYPEKPTVEQLKVLYSKG